MFRGWYMCRARVGSTSRSVSRTGRHLAETHLNPRLSLVKALTLVEVMVTMVIVMFAAIGATGAIIYTRINMEMEKQRIAALGYCRQSMETMQSLDDTVASTKVLVPFNAPGVENLDASVQVEYYKINSNGTVDWGTSLTAASLEEPVFARVSVSWMPYGSARRPQEVSMSTVLTRGID